jgi:protein gp37
MSDLFHEGVPKPFIQQVWATMEAAQWHTFQILTKRPERMRLLADQLQLLPNVWLGTSVENAGCLWRLRELQATRAAVRFASFEPLLGPVDHANLEGIDWAVVGGESGPGARLPKIDWVRAIRDRCKEDGVAFFFKQWGGARKKESGRQLDGRTWDDKPEAYRAHRPEPGRANGQEQTIGNIGTTIQMASR